MREAKGMAKRVAKVDDPVLVLPRPQEQQGNQHRRDIQPEDHSQRSAFHRQIRNGEEETQPQQSAVDHPRGRREQDGGKRLPSPA